MTRKPEIGAETAQAVLDIIESNPEKHSQWIWANATPECGTTHCAGGWALAVHGEEWKLYDAFDNCYTSRAAELLGLKGEVFGLWRDEPTDAYRLFFQTTNSQAVEALRYIAGGKEIDWEKVYGE